MKIVQTPARFCPAIGGVEKYVRELSAQLVHRGHEVTVVCANEPVSEAKQVQGISVKRLPYIGKIANTNITLPLLPLLLQQDFDVIHTHMPTPWSAELSLLAAKLKRKPCVLTYHNDVEKTGLLGLLTKIYNATVLRVVLSAVDKILITQPRYLTDSRILASYHGKIAVIPNGISYPPEQQFRPGDPAKVLFVSVLDSHHRYKGLEYLIQAVARLRETRPDVQLEIVGQGDLLGEYQALVVQLRLEQHVHFWGYVDDDKLADLYRQCAVFVLPSVDTHEGFGIVLLEAMAYSRPVVTTQAVGLSAEITSYNAGQAVRPRDATALAAAIRHILDNPEIGIRMGENGRRLVGEKYLWGEIVQRVERIYQELVL